MLTSLLTANKKESVSDLPIRIDILSILEEQGPSRPSEIREKLKLRLDYKEYSDRSLDVIIRRALKDLEEKKIVCREVKGFQMVVYSLREDAKHKIERTLIDGAISSAISEGKLAKADISKSEIQEQVFAMRLEQIKNYLQNSPFHIRLTTRSEEAQFFLTNMVSWLSKSAQEFSIMILQSKEESLVKLTEEEMLRLLGKAERRDLIRGAFNVRAHLARSHLNKESLPIADTRFGEMWILLRWQPEPKLSKEKVLSRAFEDDKKCFITWLLKFKNLSCNAKLIDYTCHWVPRRMTKRTRREDLSSEEMKEALMISRLYSEYNRKKDKYEAIYIKGF
jgi:hypothetical protein